MILHIFFVKSATNSNLEIINHYLEQDDLRGLPKLIEQTFLFTFPLVLFCKMVTHLNVTKCVAIKDREGSLFILNNAFKKYF